MRPIRRFFSIVMIPVKMNAGPKTRIILAGDPKQLGPITRSPVAERLGLATSWLDRLMAMPLYDPERFSGVTFVYALRFCLICRTLFNILAPF